MLSGAPHSSLLQGQSNASNNNSGRGDGRFANGEKDHQDIRFNLDNDDVDVEELDKEPDSSNPISDHFTMGNSGGRHRQNSEDMRDNKNKFIIEESDKEVNIIRSSSAQVSNDPL
jgi:hypothetical protein